MRLEVAGHGVEMCRERPENDLSFIWGFTRDGSQIGKGSWLLVGVTIEYEIVFGKNFNRTSAGVL